ncbi:MAG: undecaprenyl-phosphate glucose phosphotransferase [Acetobacteraceae bacterium]
MPGVAERDIALRLRPDAHGPQSGIPGYASGPAAGIRAEGISLILFFTDLFFTAAIGLLCWTLVGGPAGATANAMIPLLGVMTLSVVLSFWERGLYAPNLAYQGDVAPRRLILAWLQAIGIVVVLALCIIAATRSSQAWPALSAMAQSLAGAWFPTFVAAGLSGIMLARVTVRRLTQTRVAPRQAIVVGATATGAALIRRFDEHPPQGFSLVGVIEHDRETDFPPETATSLATFNGFPILGGIDALERLIRRGQVDTVLLTLPLAEATQIRAIVTRIAMSPVDVYVVPDLDSLKLPERPVAMVAGMPLLMASRRPLSGWQDMVKRAEDLFLGSLLLLAASPALFGVALAVKLTSPGPVFFRQRRLGFNNQVINVLKFRTMHTHLSDADACRQTQRGDKRLTSIGGFLRRTSLDELPQLLNVVRGDMSLVGPRPHALQTTAGGLPLDVAVPEYSSRHRVKPGITGWAQVNGYRGALETVEQAVHRVRHDLHYIENWSLLLDIKILVKTVTMVLFDDNAY